MMKTPGLIALNIHRENFKRGEFDLSYLYKYFYTNIDYTMAYFRSCCLFESHLQARLRHGHFIDWPDTMPHTALGVGNLSF